MTFPAGKQQEEASREQADTSSNERPNDIEENKDVNTTKNRQVTASVLLQTGGGTIVDPKLALSNDTLKQQQSAPENADDGNNNNGKLTLEHMKKLLRTSKRFEHVTEEHIERVRMIHDRFVQKASLSFNYNTLLFVASVLAGLGLASDSTSTIIASVLVSPLMGPVMGMAYGFTIKDYDLVKHALFTETVSILVCIVMGCLIGLTTGWTDLANDWPTSVMLDRGSWQMFFVSCPVAFVSGLAVAVGQIDEQTNSLVGVAISSALLPPAVNAGIMWVAYGFAKNNIIQGSTMAPTMAPTSSNSSAGTARLLDLSDNTDILQGETHYEHYQFLEFGGISMAITLSTILLIIVASIFMFRLKEVLPIKKAVFWDDLRIARKIYQKRAVLAVAKNEPAVLVTDDVDVADNNETIKSGVLTSKVDERTEK